MKHKTPNYRFRDGYWQAVPLRQTRKDLVVDETAPELLACAHDGDVKTELLRFGQRFVVYSRNVRCKTAGPTGLMAGCTASMFQTEREAFEFFLGEAG